MKTPGLVFTDVQTTTMPFIVTLGRWITGYIDGKPRYKLIANADNHWQVLRIACRGNRWDDVEWFIEKVEGPPLFVHKEINECMKYVIGLGVKCFNIEGVFVTD